MKRFVVVTIVGGLFVLLSSLAVFAAVPQLINYQGVLSDSLGEPVADGSYSATFTIYNDASAGSSKWTETQTVNTIDGLFSVLLGSINPMADTVFNEIPRYLGIRVGADAEITPRTQLVSMPYTFRSVLSETADNADLLDGNDATAFALNSHNHDASYVNDTGDVMSGSLGFDNGGFPMTYIYQSGTGNPERAVIAHSPSFPSYGLFYEDNTDDWHFKFVGTSYLTIASNGNVVVEGGSNPSTFNSFVAGNSSVVLPSDAVSAAEILDEPGIAFNSVSAFLVLSRSDTPQDLVTVSITLPTAGYVVVEGMCTVVFNSTTSSNLSWMQIDTAAGGVIHEVVEFTWLGEEGYSNASNHFRTATIKKVYFLNAGTYTFRVEGNAWLANDPSAFTGIFRAQIQATFYPTSYGTVTSTVATAGDYPEAQSISFTDPQTGERHQAYQVDLRYYENLAKQARIKSLEAELELRKAREVAMRQKNDINGATPDDNRR